MSKEHFSLIESCRDNKPPFVLITDIEDLSSKGIASDIISKIRNFLEELSGELGNLGCPVNFDKKGDLDFSDGRGMIINPVYIGELSEELIRALKGETRDIRWALKNLLPEKGSLEDLSAIKKGGELTIGLHPNFTNLVIFKDPEEVFSFLQGRPVIEFLRALMIKTGAWKIIGFPITKEGNFGMPILGTMEQGHPRLDNLEELAFRLKTLASVKKVGGVENLELAVSKNEWVNAKSISQLMDLGVFLGENGLLDPPTRVDQYLKNPSLIRLVTALIKFTRQQEGAYAFWTPEFCFPQLKDDGLNWDGVMVVTRTGSDNGMAVKTNPDCFSFVAGIPLKDGKFGKISVFESEVGKPSVEAEEFSFPLRGFESLEMQWGERLIKGPPIIGIVHLHRGLDSYEPNKVLYAPPDLKNFPPVGCGVDAMAKLSENYMGLLIDKWQKEGFQQEMGVYYAPNHGINIIIFPRFDNGKFFYPDDPFLSFKNAIKNGSLRLTRDVPQW